MVLSDPVSYTHLDVYKRQGYVTSRHEEAMNELLRTFKLIRTGQLRVNSFLSAKVFPSGSILDRIEYSFKYLDVPQLIQYQYMDCLLYTSRCG